MVVAVLDGLASHYMGTKMAMRYSLCPSESVVLPFEFCPKKLSLSTPKAMHAKLWIHARVPVARWRLLAALINEGSKDILPLPWF
jgi:hypothetical protein